MELDAERMQEEEDIAAARALSILFTRRYSMLRHYNSASLLEEEGQGHKYKSVNDDKDEEDINNSLKEE